MKKEDKEIEDVLDHCEQAMERNCVVPRFHECHICSSKKGKAKFRFGICVECQERILRILEDKPTNKVKKIFGDDIYFSLRGATNNSNMLYSCTLCSSYVDGAVFCNNCFNKIILPNLRYFIKIMKVQKL